MVGTSTLKRAIRGSFRRLAPRVMASAWRTGVSDFRFPRGTLSTTGRHYIDRFLHGHRADIRGRVLEFGKPYYKSLADPARLQRYCTFDIDPELGPDFVGDIQDCPQIPDASFDCILCTQVLEHVANPFRAAAELNRILAPGGVLLLTVPASYPYHAVPRDYWRYTRDSLELLFAGLTERQITPQGNRVTVMAAYWFWAATDLPRWLLDRPDPNNPTILTLRGVKAKAA